jgi:peptidoglycan/xylan/chitin deacetylase (PgdA/CDA1 family)
MKKLNFILTSDDVGRDSVENFKKFVSFLDEYGIKCTFFAVPKPRDNMPLNENKEWIIALKKAIQLGHDVQLHGFTHERFECGFPNKLVLSMYEKEARKNLMKEMTDNKEKIEENLSLDKLTSRLLKSKKLFEKALGYSPICFRSPLLGMHENLYKALAKTGIKYSTNIVVNPSGWSYINREKNFGKVRGKKRILPVMTKAQGGIIELPISCEYSWFLKKENMKRALKLMKRDARKISKIENSFMLPMSHFYSIVKEPAGEELYRKFFEWARKNFYFKSYTINEYAKEKSIKDLNLQIP